jgi:hypothetical protein
MWTSQQKDALWKKWCEDDHLDDIVRCERIASEAVSLFLARASGQAKEDLAELRATIDHSWGQSDAQNAADRASLDRLSALAQEAESLRAKVAEVEKLVEGGHRLYRDLERAHAENRAEVERLKDERAELQGQVTRRETEIGELEDRLTSARSEVERLTREHRNCAHDLHTAQEWGRARQAEVEILKAENAELQCQNRSNLERANQFEYEAIGRTRLYKAVTRERDAAESRLAAVRERASDPESAACKWIGIPSMKGSGMPPSHQRSASDNAARLLRWVLEGDAPRGGRRAAEIEWDEAASSIERIRREILPHLPTAYREALARVLEDAPQECKDGKHELLAQNGAIGCVRCPHRRPVDGPQDGKAVPVPPGDPVGALAKAAGARTGCEVASYRCGYEQACDDMRAAWKAMRQTGAHTCGGEGFYQRCLDTAKREDQEDAFERGSESMREACLTIALEWAKAQGYIDGSETLADLKHSIEGAAP